MGVHIRFSAKKAQIAVAYLARKRLPELTVGKICKLIFLADKLHLVQVGRTITGDTYYAFDHGPVPSATYDLLKTTNSANSAFVAPFDIDVRYQYPRYSLRKGARVDFAYLSKSDVASLDETIRRYGERTFAELRAITHEMPEYKHAWNERRTGEDAKSAPMRFIEFFEQDEDAMTGALEEVIENARIAGAISAHH